MSNGIGTWFQGLGGWLADKRLTFGTASLQADGPAHRGPEQCTRFSQTRTRPGEGARAANRGQGRRIPAGLEEHK